MPRAAWTVSHLLALAVALAVAPHAQGPSRMTKLAIAHRGASAYAPEHTLAAYRLAIEQKADYVEQDLAVTKDGTLVCLHDDSLERTTNVEQVFPDRAAVDHVTGRRQWLVVDFTLAEIKRLDAGSWFGARFAGERVPTWEEAIALVGTAAGLYPELKSPPLYRARGIDMTGLFVASLRRAGLDQAPAHRLVVQSFDEQTLREVTKTLPSLARTFLIEGRDGPRWLSAPGFAEISRFATGIGPTKRLLEGRPELVTAARTAGLTVTPYTFTSRATSRFPDVRDEMHHYLFDLGVDALFTDNPDRFPRGGL
jgi:glycerophosphoryl diester phosphodiesterase